MKVRRSILDISGIGAILFGGVLALPYCDQSYMPKAEFEKMCKNEVRVKVLDPVLWEKYVQLAIENGPRPDGKTSPVGVEGFTLLYGKERDGSRPSSTEEGTDVEEIAILYSGREIAILLDKFETIKTGWGLNGFATRSCVVEYGLSIFIKNGKL